MSFDDECRFERDGPVRRIGGNRFGKHDAGGGGS